MNRKFCNSFQYSKKLKYPSFNQLDMSELLLHFKILTIIEERALCTRGKNVLFYLKSPFPEFNSFYKLIKPTLIKIHASP